ncbi:MAG: hypothetical protein HOW73_15880 [Polyangiaceae bacterium]|nr:hypothetical protein [Polyangiaceae bacterium]
MNRVLKGAALASLALVSFACGEPTLEEACTSYCEAAQDAGCGELLPAECSTGCGDLEAALEQVGYGDCIEEYTAAMDCVAGSGFTCNDGVPVANGSGCLEEALDLVDCQQSLNPDN